ncbi:MAG: hypothetical protein E7071_08900 [Bacteroidales bacterium]|nr:hypothetical protein [Bacteroidales bacterium]
MFFKQPDIPKFRYVPRYYDPKKEAKERRMKRYEEGGMSEEEKREEFRRRIRARYAEQSARTRQSGKVFGNQTTRFFLIVITMLIAGLFIYAKYGEAIMNFFLNY